MDFLVQLDPKLQEFIVWAVSLAVSFLFLQLSNIPQLAWLAEYLGQYKVGIVTWISTIFFNVIQSWLNQIPQTWDNVVVLVMQLLVEVISILTVFALYRRSKAKGYQAL